MIKLSRVDIVCNSANRAASRCAGVIGGLQIRFAGLGGLVGFSVGLLVGVFVGRILVGVKVGAFVGRTRVGRFVGAGVGRMRVGLCVGVLVGRSTGTPVGRLVG